MFLIVNLNTPDKDRMSPRSTLDALKLALQYKNEANVVRLTTEEGLADIKACAGSPQNCTYEKMLKIIEKEEAQEIWSGLPQDADINRYGSMNGFESHSGALSISFQRDRKGWKLHGIKPPIGGNFERATH